MTPQQQPKKSGRPKTIQTPFTKFRWKVIAVVIFLMAVICNFYLALLVLDYI